MISTVAWVFIAPVVFYYLSKILWRFYILWRARDPSSEFRNLPIPPGDFGLPVIGETHLWAVQGSRFNSLRREKYGRVFSTNFIGKTMVKVTGPTYVKQVLTANYDTIGTIWPTSVRRILGNSAIANTVGATHRSRRRAFLKAFTQEALDSYIPQMQKLVAKKITSWCDSSRTPLIYPETKELTFDVSFKTLVGLNFKNEGERRTLFQTFDTMITNLLSLPYDLPGSGFRKALKAKHIIHDTLENHVKRIRERATRVLENDGDEMSEEESNVLQIVLRAQIQAALSANQRKIGESPDPESPDEDEEELMSDIELKEATVELLFAGYQTTASVLTSAIINFIKSPEVYKKLEQEMREFGLLSPEHNYLPSRSSSMESSQSSDNSDVTDSSLVRNRRIPSDVINNNPQDGQDDCFCDPNSRAITIEKLSKMVYLEQVMKETLRIMPPILGGYRVAKKTFQMGNYRIPKGWTIIYNIRDTHEAEWSEDMDFKPERFSPENWKDNKESRYRWIAFGGGPRMCIGKEFARIQFKVFIIELVRRFSRLEFAKGKPPPMFAVPFLHPTDGLPVKLTPRNPEKIKGE